MKRPRGDCLHDPCVASARVAAARRRTARRVVAAVVVTALALALGSCDRAGSPPTPRLDGAAPPLSTPTATLPPASPDASPSPRSESVPPFTDPRELAAYYARHAEAGNWAALQPLLAEEYQAFAYGEGTPFDHYISDLPRGTTWGQRPDEWDVEDRGARSIVRLLGKSPIPLVMRRLPDDTLRLDPGPCALQRAAYWTERPEGNQYGMEAPGYQKEIQGPDEVIRTVQQNFQDLARCVSYAAGGVTVTPVWTFWTGPGSIATAGLSWTAGDRRGPARVVWTDAVVTADGLAFPVPRMAYTVTLLLDGAPADAGAPSSSSVTV